VTRRRRFILGFVVVAAAVVLLGSLRDRGTNEDTERGNVGEGARAGADKSAEDARLEEVDELVEVEAGTDCQALGEVDRTRCSGFLVDDQERAWVIEDLDDGPAVAFYRRESSTAWRRLLRVSAADGDFDEVGTLLQDVTGDGRAEIAFGFRRDGELEVDVVEPDGVVIFHLDVGEGSVAGGDGVLLVDRPDGDGWRREEVAVVRGLLQTDEVGPVDEPAEDGI